MNKHSPPNMPAPIIPVLVIATAASCGYLYYYPRSELAGSMCILGMIVVPPGQVPRLISAGVFSGLTLLHAAYTVGATVTVNSCVTSYQDPSDVWARRWCSNGVAAGMHVMSDTVLEPLVHDIAGIPRRSVPHVIVKPLVRGGVAASAFYVTDLNKIHSLDHLESALKALVRYGFKVNGPLFGALSKIEMHKILAGVTYPIVKELVTGADTMCVILPFSLVKGIKEIALTSNYSKEIRKKNISTTKIDSFSY